MHHQDSFSTIEDFVFNPSFRDWLTNNNSQYKEFWENWMMQNPAKVPVLNYAKAIVFALTVNHKQLSEDEISKEIRAIMQKTSGIKQLDPKTVSVTPARKSLVPLFAKLALAAAVITICFLTVLYLAANSPGKETMVELAKTPAERSRAVIDQVNNADSIQVINLEDGSNVHLHPKSRLSYSKEFGDKKREVYLTGQAFFNVRKNPSVAFVVYTKDIVTKVLGTSFNVKAFPDQDNAIVQVVTGKVSVYKKENFAEKNSVANKLDGLIVIPNQEVIYDVAKDQLRKSIIDRPVTLSETLPQTFVFNSTPLKEVFRVLQKTYGINIIYDESVINSCSLSASMGDESFYDKLELICKAINASYESVDGTIFISSQGCK